MGALQRLLDRRGVAILDGALATELERHGRDLDHPLWSARCLLEDPAAIGAVHRAYLDVGADVITSSGYQATVAGFQAEGLSRAEAIETYRESIRIACRARDAFAAERGLGRDERPLVAASIGPWGATLCDGSEYRGRYAIDERELERFHAERLALAAEELRAGQADLVACETIPSLAEALLLARLAQELGIDTWIAFSCRSATEIGEGQPVERAARALDVFDAVVAIGVNCTAPAHVPGVLARMRTATGKPLIAYPNSGEVYRAEEKDWLDPGVASAPLWYDAGAALLGGCCRTTPADVERIVRWRAARG